LERKVFAEGLPRPMGIDGNVKAKGVDPRASHIFDEFMAALGASRLSFVPGLLGKCERILGANNQLEQNGI
jgi:hypothetical protein